MSATLNYRRILERTNKAERAASSALTTWAIANGHGNVRFRDLEPLVPPELWKADREAREARCAAERAAVDAGRGWFNERGVFNWYSPSDIRRFAAQRRRMAR